MLNRNSYQTSPRRRRDQRSSRTRRRWHALERLESRCVLAATVSGQVFDDLNGDQAWQPSAPNNEPALDCWTVFIDSNKNGGLDQGEPQQLTASNGSYSFNLSTPGEYVIELVQEPGFDRTTPIRFGLSTNLVSGAVRDHAFDPIRKVLYGTDGDRVLRTNPQTGDTLAALAFGTSLTGVDVTPDGKYLLVGESTTSEGAGKLYKIDLATNAVTTINYTLVGQEGGVFDIAAVSDDRVLFTTSSPATDRVLLRELNLTTNQVTPRPEIFSEGASAGEILPNSRLERNSTRTSLLLVTAHDPTGSVHLYESASNSFVRSSQLADTLDNAHVAISRDGKRLAVQSANLGLKVFDDHFALVKDLPHYRGGISFDSVRNIFYAGDTDADQLVAIDTATWNELYRVAVGEDLPATGTYYEMQVNNRSKFLSVTTPTGMRYVQLDRAVSHVVTVADNQVIEHLDFGNWANGENRRPKAVSDNYTLAEDTILDIAAPGVLVNDADPDGNSLQAQINIGPQHGSVNLLPDGSFIYTPDADYFGSDSFTYRSNDGTLSSCRTATVQIDVTSVNDAPSDISITGTTVDENVPGVEVGEIDVVDADQDDQIVLQVSDGRFEIVDGKLRLKDGQSLDHEQGATIDLTITATDNGSPPRSITEVVTVEVNDENEFDPTIQTTTIESPENGTTVGTVEVTDGDSSQVTEITIVGGNEDGIFSIDPNTGVITVNAGHQLDHEGTRIYEVTVSVTDNVEPRRTTTDVITIEITDVNEEDPSINEQTFEVAENSPNGTVVGQVSGTDGDTSESLIYSINGGNDSGAFAIESTSGVITVADVSQLDREQLEQFVLEVQVTDSGSPSRSSSANVTIKVLNVNEFNPIVISQDDLVLQEDAANDTVVTVFQANDPDAVSDIVYSIAGASSGFAINSQTGEIRVANSSALDAEGTNPIVLEILVTDQLAPPRSSTGTVKITLTDVNEFDPQLAEGLFTVPETAPSGHAVGTAAAIDQDLTYDFQFEIIDGNDEGVFAINSDTGVITVANTAPLQDAEGTQFDLTVRVSDGGSPSRTGDAEFVITVSPGNTTSPTVEDLTFSIAENSPNGTVVGTVPASDPDVGTSFSYSITGDSNGVFAINASTGEITVANSSALDYESVVQFTFTVSVNDGGVPNLTDDAQVTIDLTDVNEAAPSLNDATVTIAENTANGTVVATMSATDADSRQSLTYSISGGVLSIHPTTGVVTVANSGQLNFESATSLVATVTVTDSGNPTQSDTATITVNLTDANEAAPVVNNLTVSIDENPQVGLVVGRVTAADADSRQTLTYSLSGGNVGGGFAINATSGEITVASSAIIDAESVPQFLLLVTVTDNGSPSQSGTGAVTVNVQGINEPPTGVTLAGDSVPQQVSGASVGLVSAIDPDAGDVHTFTVDDTRFTIDANRILKLKNGVSLGVDENSPITVIITATDALGLSASEDFVLQVTENPAPWRNPVNPFDTNGDGVVSPLDVLLVINEINNPRITDLRGRLPIDRPDVAGTPFPDVNGDGVVSPLDALNVINKINEQPSNQAEGEGYVQMPHDESNSADSADLAPHTSFSGVIQSPALSMLSIGKGDSGHSNMPQAKRHATSSIDSSRATASQRAISTDHATQSPVQRRNLNDLEDTLDDLAADIASAWSSANGF